jgi:diguanylate cyclase (GGDEF)-like protein
LLGFGAAQFMSPLAPYVWAFAAYVGIGVLFQWMIQRRAFRTITRALMMGAVDTLFVTFFVQRLGTASSALPIVYVAAPVLYATTTPRRRVALFTAWLGLTGYAATVLLEQLGVIGYAPGMPELARPDVSTAFSTFLLVALCTATTATLTSQLISALGNANTRLRDLSQHDELTGLYNRRYVMLRLEEELNRGKRKSGSAALAMIDLDGFKRVNDELGHDAGDAVLKAVASALLAATRKIDVVARYGGDEFVILLPNTEPDGARAVSVRMLDQAREAACLVCPQIPVSASIGTTALRATDDSAETLRRVDEQLYAAKRAGGDRILVD